jgi:hypothetical protein
MAEKLKRENDIVTLKIELLASDRVHCTLQFLDGGRLLSHPLWQGDAAEFGLGSGTGRPGAWLKSARFALPQALKTQLAAGLDDWQRMSPSRERALWVHLAKPYGALRYVPWERLLVQALAVPVLMLPDFIFPPPRESVADLDVVLCASAPLNCERHHVFDALMKSIDAIRQGLHGQRSRLHVFADIDMTAMLGSIALPEGALLHSPQDAAPYVAEDPSSRLHDKTGSLRSPWLLWMREALRPYSTDVVHFVCHGHLSGHYGALLLAQSPLARTDNYLAGPVGCTELGCFLTGVGAWSTVFSAPGDNHDPTGLRALADEIAQTLPGPMMLCDPVLASVSDVAQGYRFVHSPSPQSPPYSPGLFLYCQPYLLSEDRGEPVHDQNAEALKTRIQHYARNDSQRESALRSIPAVGPMLSAVGDAAFSRHVGKSVSAVTAATERMAEQVQVQYQQLMRDEVIPEDIAHRDLQTAMDTINSIRDAVSRMERQRLLGEIDSRLDRVEQANETSPLPLGASAGDAADAQAVADAADVDIADRKKHIIQSVEFMKQTAEMWSQLRELPQAEFTFEIAPHDPSLKQIDASGLEGRIFKLQSDLEERAHRYLEDDAQGAAL